MLKLSELQEANLKKFESLDEAKEFYRGYFKYFKKYDKEFCKVGDELILMCCTTKAYDDKVDRLIETLFETVLCSQLGFKWCVDFDFDLVDLAKSLSETFRHYVEEFAEFKTVYLYEKF